MTAIQRRMLLVIGGVALARILLLCVLGLFGLDVGLKVWPMIEDRNWTCLLFPGNGPTAVARAFWGIDSRNPLSPWWYSALGPILLGPAPYTWLYPVRLAMSVALSGAVFLVVDELGRRRRTSVAVFLGLGVLFWDFSVYDCQIQWPFHGALAISMLGLWWYLRFLDSGRTRPYDLVFALGCYAVTIGTYTLHCGLFIAVALLGLARPSSTVPLRERARGAVLDAGCFAAVLVIFVLAWTSSTLLPGDVLALGRAPKQLLSSVGYLAWHQDLTLFVRRVVQGWPVALWLGAFLAATFAFATLGRVLERWLEPAEESGAEGPGARGPDQDLVVGLLVIILAVCAPMVAIESLSAAWYPGTRSRMIHQVYEPMRLCTLLLVAAWLRPAWRTWLLRGGLAAMCAGSVVLGADYNRELCVRTAFERRWKEALAPVVRAMPRPAYLLIRLGGKSKPWNYDTLSDRYIQSWFEDAQVHMRVLQREPAPQVEWTWWRIQFGDEVVGVRYAAPFSASLVPVPWSHVVLVDFDGERLTVPTTITSLELAEFQVDFHRVWPISQALLAERLRASGVATGK